MFHLLGISTFKCRSNKTGAPYYCFHDYDLAEEGVTFSESTRRLGAIVDYAKEKQAACFHRSSRSPLSVVCLFRF